MIVLTGATVITCEGDQIIRDGAVVLEGERIRWVGPAGEAPPAPPDAVVYDARGKTVLPGLVNAHIHFTMRRGYGVPAKGSSIADDAFRAVRAALACLKEGVTSARDTGHLDYVHRELQRAIADGIIVGPRIHTSGDALVMSYGHAYFMCKVVRNAQEAADAVLEQIHAGVDFIKVITSQEDLFQYQGEELAVPWFPPEALKAIAETAHSAGTPVTGHANGNRAIRRVIEAGFDSIEHGIYLNAENARLMKQTGMFLTPTMTGYRRNGDISWKRGARWAERYGKLAQVHPGSVRNALEHDVPIATGTDTLGLLDEEIAILIEIGMRPIDAIKAATINGARLCRMDDRIGSLVSGKLADLIVVDGDPLADPSTLRWPEAVFKGGVRFTPAQIDAFVPPSPLFAEGW
ncbi:MAG: amidohydrolase family protein [Chloroflexi bacterium]|nr:amidohydrolase family protein [Chloroflexota bacterium]